LGSLPDSGRSTFTRREHIRRVIGLSDPESPITRLMCSRRVKVLRPESGNEPNVYFLT